jgi:hypothetical protein
VGKSRLIAELLAHVEANPELVRWRQGRRVPYGEGITFWALGQIVKAEAGSSKAEPCRPRRADGWIDDGRSHGGGASAGKEPCFTCAAIAGWFE